MALQNSQTLNIAVAGSQIAHGIAMTPDEVTVLPTIAAGAGQTYRYSAADSTYIYLAQGTSATSAVVVAKYHHSLVR